MLLNTIILLLCNICYVLSRSEQPLAAKIWRERCPRHSLALNDCNWCHCNVRLEYTCTARICSQVDMFGHFNDAIREMDVGMEGHGVWRSKDTACEPGVHYKKGELLCACTSDGKWPNPVCRDVFQILHTVTPTKYELANNQTCSSSKLYQIGCNVCYCPSTGRIDPNFCTKRNCTDDVSEPKKRMTKNDRLDEIYAACERAKKYQVGCKTCVCLPNNRLLCDNCTSITNFNTKPHSKSKNNGVNLCSKKEPGKTFKKDCNICYCDQKDIVYCTVLQCLKAGNKISLPEIEYQSVDPPVDDNDCIPGTKYNRQCNTCHCFKLDGIKYFGCTLRKCDKTENYSCVEGKRYEKNCLVCDCVRDGNETREFCTYNHECKTQNKKTKNVALDAMHGYCEPLHTYKQGCNKCRCLTDGNTVACTSKICPSELEASPVIVELIPFIQKQSICPKGRKYKVDCNLCECMSNGNTICTTKSCNRDILQLNANYL